MFGSSQFLHISLEEVFKRIDAGTLVVTPNRRLALALKEKFDQYQIASQQKTVWYPIDVLPFKALLERIYFDVLYSERTFSIPLLLSATQRQALWELIIQDSVFGESLLRIPQTAQWVQEAWQLAHTWQFIDRLDRYPSNEDGKAFSAWANAFEAITARDHLIDEVQLCDWITKRYDELDIKKPSTLIGYGFDVVTPQQGSFLQTLANGGCQVLMIDSTKHHAQSRHNVRRIECIDAEDEIHQAALWARDRLEANPSARIGVVVPELTKYRSVLVRIFDTVMYPDARHALPTAGRPVAPFNVSLGLPLASYPLINTALLILTLVEQGLSYSQVSHCLRSPFVRGGESEMGKRALLDVRCRQYIEPTTSLQRLLAILYQAGGQTECPVLWQSLSVLRDFQQTGLPKIASHKIYAEAFQEILRIIGFPGERSLSSVEYQTAEKWRSLISEFVTLDHIRTDIGYHEAVSRLKQMAQVAVFQPKTPSVPIQILGVLEAAGMEFDHLWVVGLSDEQWPVRAQPNPFLPISLQRKAGLPLGSTQEALVYCRKLTDGWLTSAPEIVFSSPQFSDDRDRHRLEPSALIRTIAHVRPVYRSISLYRDVIAASCELQSVEDDRALPLGDGSVKGGTSVLKDYAACPFRAWARHRLAIDRLRVPHVGLDAMERGALMHQVLARLWLRLQSKAALDAMEDTNLEKLLEIVTADAISALHTYRPAALTERLKEIEQRRLVKLMRTWLTEERKRAPFVVMAVEEKHSVHINDLELNVRLDRVDELEDGRLLIIDYKTSAQSVAAMLGARPDEPQLPLYLVMTDLRQSAAGIAFATIRFGEMKFVAIPRDDYVLPGAKAFSDIKGCESFDTWDDLLAAWQRNLTELAAGFCSGDARVSPKNYPITCMHCDFQSFCRIHERIAG